MFGYVLRELISARRGLVDIVVPNRIWEEHISLWPLPAPTIRTEARGVELPLVLAVTPDSRRGFVFCDLAIEEVRHYDTEDLWTLALLAGVQERVGSRSLSFSDP